MAIHKVDGVDGVNHFPKKYVTLVADGTISEGDWVVLDTAEDNGLGSTVIVANTGTTGHDSMIFGVATEAAVDGGSIRIQTAGKYTNGANVEAATVYGDALIASSSAGRAIQADTLSAASASYAFVICGVALEPDGAGATETDDAGATKATNYAAVMITDQGYF
jgi:hypothetical protein